MHLQRSNFNSLSASKPRFGNSKNQSSIPKGKELALQTKLSFQDNYLTADEGAELSQMLQPYRQEFDKSHKTGNKTGPMGTFPLKKANGILSSDLSKSVFFDRELPVKSSQIKVLATVINRFLLNIHQSFPDLYNKLSQQESPSIAFYNFDYILTPRSQYSDTRQWHSDPALTVLTDVLIRPHSLDGSLQVRSNGQTKADILSKETHNQAVTFRTSEFEHNASDFRNSGFRTKERKVLILGIPDKKNHPKYWSDKKIKYCHSFKLTPAKL